MLTKPQMTYKKSMIAQSLTIALLMTGCAQNSTDLKPYTQPTIPALSSAAQPPQQIELCSSSCLSNHTLHTESLLNTLTETGKQ